MRRLLVLLALMLAGCVSARAVLVNDKGEYTSCAATSGGLIGSAVAQHTFDKCVAEAKEKGYRIESESK